MLIVGHGEMGQAMEYLLAPRHRLDLWFRPHGSRRAAVTLEEAAGRADAVLLCVPAQPIGGLVERIRDRLPPHCSLWSIAKGLDDAGRPAAAILQDGLPPGQPWGVIYGPMISEEIRAGRPAYAEVAGRPAEAVGAVRALFAGSHLHLQPAADLVGLSWSAVLKNVYAMAFGGADGLGLGDNARGYLAAAALAEMGAIVAALGGSRETVCHLAGLGDLITTATSAGSHHHELGRRLVQGRARELTGEGVHTLAMIRRHRLWAETPYPLLRVVRHMVETPAEAAGALRAFLERR